MTEAMEAVLQQLMAFPPSHKEAEDLTERERIALCIAAGCKMDYRTENTPEGGYRMVATTVNRVGFAKINGRFHVYESAPSGDEERK